MGGDGSGVGGEGKRGGQPLYTGLAGALLRVYMVLSNSLRKLSAVYKTV